MTKSERLDSIEANLSMLSEIMQTMIEQQQKQLEEQQQQLEAVEPTNEGLTKAIVENYANKITNLMENKDLKINDVIELITKCNLTLIDRLRIADRRYKLYFIEPINHNVVGFTIDTELRKVLNAELLY